MAPSIVSPALDSPAAPLPHPLLDTAGFLLSPVLTPLLVLISFPFCQPSSPPFLLARRACTPVHGPVRASARRSGRRPNATRLADPAKGEGGGGRDYEGRGHFISVPRAPGQGGPGACRTAACGSRPARFRNQGSPWMAPSATKTNSVTNRRSAARLQFETLSPLGPSPASPGPGAKLLRTLCVQVSKGVPAKTGVNRALPGTGLAAGGVGSHPRGAATGARGLRLRGLVLARRRTVIHLSYGKPGTTRVLE